MAFSKTAKAIVTETGFGSTHWENFRSRAPGTSRVASSSSKSGNLIHQASEIIGRQFKPEEYLLTHVTIVASVNVETAQETQLGKFTSGGQTLTRKFSDYYVTPETNKYINNNNDCWSRDVILKSGNTFIGGWCFIEHIQREELSKGRLLDAVLRDTGPSVYVDLLVATELKHTDLIAAIRARTMNTLSMGCSVTECICTKCGNVAKDSTELCNHIKYEKGQTFYDGMGVQRKIAELCGHKSIDPTGGVHFIEASWVRTPAFTGAVNHGILEATSIDTAKANAVMSQPPQEWSGVGEIKAAASSELGRKFGLQDGLDMSKHAYIHNMGEGPREDDERARAYAIVLADVQLKNNDRSYVAVKKALDEIGVKPSFTVDVQGEVTKIEACVKEAFTFEDDEEVGDEAPKEEEEAEVSPIEKAKDEIYQSVLDGVVQRLNKELRTDAQKAMVDPNNTGEMATSTNDNLQASFAPKMRETFRNYVAGVSALKINANSDAEFLNKLALYNEGHGIRIEIPLYRTALEVGSIENFESQQKFLQACRLSGKRSLSKSDSVVLLKLGTLLKSRS